MKSLHQNRLGFALYLAFVVTTALFFFSLGSLDLVRSSLDASRSGLLATVSFHAADGGLEIGLAHLRKVFSPFTHAFQSDLGRGREVRVAIEAVKTGESMNLRSEAQVFDGNKLVARKRLNRLGIKDSPGRADSGTFTEES